MFSLSQENTHIEKYVFFKKALFYHAIFGYLCLCDNLIGAVLTCGVNDRPVVKKDSPSSTVLLVEIFGCRSSSKCQTKSPI